MEDIKTIDEAIAFLMKAKEKHGGDCRVVGLSLPGILYQPIFREGKAGKGKNRWKEVTRRGEPCVLISA